MEATRAEVSTARRQRDAAENHVTTIWIEQDRHCALSNEQDHAERGLRQQLAQAQLEEGDDPISDLDSDHNED